LTLLFSRRFIPMILSGAKTQTRRPAQPSVREGATYQLRDGHTPTGRRIAVERVYTQRLGDVSPDEAAREGFASVDQFARAWRAIYGSWRPDQPVYVVEFRLVGPTETFKEKTGAS
jgi:hypothetical protein